MTRLDGSVREIVTLLKIAGAQKPKADVFQLLRHWLFNAHNGEWLVILDNADDVDFLTKSSDKGSRLFDCIPICEHGAMIITSRDKNAARKLIDEEDLIDVSRMGEQDAIELLARKLDKDRTTPGFRELVTALEFMPLAITQAAAFLYHSHISNIDEYLEKLRLLDADSDLALLDWHKRDLRRDPGSTDSIILAWQISFEHIRKSRKTAADLLVQMSLCDRNSIPTLLIGTPTQRKDYSAVVEFDQDLDTLLGFLFITKSPDGKSFAMHRLVQLATRRWSLARGDMGAQVDRFLANFVESIPDVNWDTLKAWDEIYPHARSVIDLKLYVSSSSKKWRSIMNIAAIYGSYKGSRILLDQAIEMGEKCWEASKKELGDEHPDTLAFMGNLANTYERVEDYRKAKELEEKSWAATKKVFGENDRRTLISMSNLAWMYGKLGDYQTAAEMEEQCWTKKKQQLGEEDASSLTSMTHLADYYYELGKHREATDLGERCWTVKKRKFGEKDPETLETMSNLAKYYDQLGRSLEAAEMEARCWELRSVQLGKEHPDTLSSMSNLAGYKYRLGDRDEAVRMEEQCWEIKKAQLGEDHSDTLVSMMNLAKYYDARNEGRKAAELEERCLEVWRERLGEQHSEVVKSKDRLDRYRSRATTQNLTTANVSDQPVEQQSRRRRRDDGIARPSRRRRLR